MPTLKTENVTASEVAEWSFPELNAEENRMIALARVNGYASFFPCDSGREKQARNTLIGAREFLRKFDR